MCACVYTLAQYGMNWYICEYATIVLTLSSFRPNTHTHTHTPIKPFEDSEPTGLKVDIAQLNWKQWELTLSRSWKLCCRPGRRDCHRTPPLPSPEQLLTTESEMQTQNEPEKKCTNLSVPTTTFTSHLTQSKLYKQKRNWNAS